MSGFVMLTQLIRCSCITMSLGGRYYYHPLTYKQTELQKSLYLPKIIQTKVWDTLKFISLVFVQLEIAGGARF